MLRSDNLILHTLAGCCRVSVVALYEKYSLGLHSELSTLSTCVAKRQFWLYFSDMCEQFSAFVYCFYVLLFIVFFSLLPLCVLINK